MKLGSLFDGSGGFPLAGSLWLREHSQKPDIVRDKIRELMGVKQSYIELFARSTTPGWDVWGNEVNKYNSESNEEDKP